MECEEKTAAVLQQGRELQQANQQERYLLEQLQEKTKEIKSLEEGIQAEKAAHLDCKFSAEIAQVCNLATVVIAILNDIFSCVSKSWNVKQKLTKTLSWKSVLH